MACNAQVLDTNTNPLNIAGSLLETWRFEPADNLTSVITANVLSAVNPANGIYTTAPSKLGTCFKIPRTALDTVKYESTIGHPFSGSAQSVSVSFWSYVIRSLGVQEYSPAVVIGGVGQRYNAEVYLSSVNYGTEPLRVTLKLHKRAVDVNATLDTADAKSGWNFITYTYDGATFDHRVYINDVQVLITNYEQKWISGKPYQLIDTYGVTQYIDQLQVWNRKLQYWDIQKLMAETVHEYYPCISMSQSATISATGTRVWNSVNDPTLYGGVIYIPFFTNTDDLGVLNTVSESGVWENLAGGQFQNKGKTSAGRLTCSPTVSTQTSSKSTVSFWWYSPATTGTYDIYKSAGTYGNGIWLQFSNGDIKFYVWRYNAGDKWELVGTIASSLLSKTSLNHIVATTSGGGGGQAWVDTVLRINAGGAYVVRGSTGTIYFGTNSIEEHYDQIRVFPSQATQTHVDWLFVEDNSSLIPFVEPIVHMNAEALLVGSASSIPYIAPNGSMSGSATLTCVGNSYNSVAGSMFCEALLVGVAHKGVSISPEVIPLNIAVNAPKVPPYGDTATPEAASMSIEANAPFIPCVVGTKTKYQADSWYISYESVWDNTFQFTHDGDDATRGRWRAWSTEANRWTFDFAQGTNANTFIRIFAQRGTSDPQYGWTQFYVYFDGVYHSMYSGILPTSQTHILYPVPANVDKVDVYMSVGSNWQYTYLYYVELVEYSKICGVTFDANTVGMNIEVNSHNVFIAESACEMGIEPLTPNVTAIINKSQEWQFSILQEVHQNSAIVKFDIIQEVEQVKRSNLIGRTRV